eukprot:TRINITY_DN35232_c0_g1_i1.p1 TRINITY_DN35232_c0_g1~~TRINITY_DN35232_c0_g1_i1.p1  ORF type:complete len:240 (-),score=29.48 TRINITY_DN35232_c0_g1_i1:58-738(-)
MGGKSTLLRQTCLCIIMAQIGCFVPADKMRFSPVDRVFTRLGAGDSILTGQSTFMVELQEAAAVLKHSTISSFVIMDELGRGTSTFDGHSIAYSVLFSLCRQRPCRTIFSTHYHGLCDDVAHWKEVSFQHMSCISDEEARKVTFLYQLTPGTAPRSHGMLVGAMAGLPEDVLTLAEQTAMAFEERAKKEIEARGISTKVDKDQKDLLCAAFKKCDWATLRELCLKI